MKTVFVAILLLLILTTVYSIDTSAQFWEFPDTLQPFEYGNVLINRSSEKNNVLPVIFSHWRHRVKYTCRVCHFELEIQFKKNATEITEQDNRNGLFCGTCHNGEKAFGHTEENCHRCHTETITRGKRKFMKLQRLAPAKYGNKINWIKVARKTRPKYSIFLKGERSLKFNKLLKLKAEWQFVPPAIFPHSVHVRLLDCSNCHPDIFNIKKKTTKHFRMEYILEGKFCGVCHLKIAFPMNYCLMCHPGIKSS